MSVYKTIKNRSESVYREKGSRFIGIALPFDNTEKLKGLLEDLENEFPKATHYCYAYRIGFDMNNFRINDDGEPKGSAAAPILNQIDSFGLTNVIIVVIRYYGGSKLGVSGLIGAYKKAAKDALINNDIIEQAIQYKFELKCGYNEVHDLMKYLKMNKLEIVEKDFDTQCKLKIHVEERDLNLLHTLSSSLHHLNISVKELGQI